MSDKLLPDDARMDAYYYGFDRTGVDLIDAILSAVAIAGKGAHHTESWNEPNPDYYNGREGLAEGDGSAVGLIQANAERAALKVAELVAALAAAQAKLGQVRAKADEYPEISATSLTESPGLRRTYTFASNIRAILAQSDETALRAVKAEALEQLMDAVLGDAGWRQVALAQAARYRTQPDDEAANE